MNEITIGAVGAAFIAALVSIFGLIIGKEQKVSEFRQAWIDDLRKCCVAYLVNINAISDIIRVKTAGSAVDSVKLVELYKQLNEASLGISLRLNASEPTSQALSSIMGEFEVIASANSSITPENIRPIESRFKKASQDLLKFEWTRVKRGEDIFVFTKKVILAIIILLICFVAYVFIFSRMTTDAIVYQSTDWPDKWQFYKKY